MTSSVLAMVLLAALLHACWNALIKVSDEKLLLMAMMAAGSGVISLAFLPFVPVPAAASWPYLAASVVLHTGYKLFLVRAYRHGDLGQVYPIARGTAPLIVAPLSVYIAGDTISPTSALAVVVVGVGIVSLTFRRGPPLLRGGRPVAYALATAVFIAAYTLVDGLGARVAGSPHAYVVWLFLLDSAPMAAISLWQRRGATLALARARWAQGLAAAAMSMAAYWLVIYAMTVAPIGPVAALRETSVIIATIIGAVLLKEEFGRGRIIAACLVAVGIVLLRM